MEDRIFRTLWRCSDKTKLKCRPRASNFWTQSDVKSCFQRNWHFSLACRHNGWQMLFLLQLKVQKMLQKSNFYSHRVPKIWIRHLDRIVTTSLHEVCAVLIEVEKSISRAGEIDFICEPTRVELCCYSGSAFRANATLASGGGRVTWIAFVRFRRY